MDKYGLLQVFSVLIASYRQRLSRGAMIVAAMILGSAGLASVLVINETAKQSYAKASQPLVNHVYHLIVPKQEQLITKQDYAALRRQGLTNSVAVSEVNLRLDKTRRIRIIGLDFYALLNLHNQADTLFSPQSDQSVFDSEWRYLASPDFFNRLVKLDLIKDDNLLLNSTEIGPILSYAGSGMGSVLVADIDTVFQDFPDSQLTSLMVVGDEIDSEAIHALLPAHLSVRELTTGVDAQELTASFHLNLLAMGLLMFAVCLFVIMNALHLLLSDRMGHFKILRQLGIPVKSLCVVSIFEILLLSILSSLLGVFLGLKGAAWLSPGVNQTLANLYGVSVGFGQFSFFSILLKCLLASCLGGLAAIAFPLLRINAQLNSAKDVVAQHREASRWGRLALLCALLAGVVLLVFEGLVSGLVVIALLLFSGCFTTLFLVPTSLALGTTLIPPSRPILQWTLGDALRIANKSNLAFCAFFIAVAANIGMNLMVDSFRNATDAWIQQRLDADAYVYTQEALEVLDWLAKEAPPVQAYLRTSEQGRFRSSPLEILSFPVNKARQPAMQFYEADPRVWSLFTHGNGILVNQQFAFSKNVTVGDILTLSDSANKKQSYKVAGVYLDYGNPKIQALLPAHKINDSTVGRKIIALYLPNNDNVRLPSLLAALSNEFEATDALITDDLLTLSMQTFDRTFVVTDGLNMVTLLVAALSLAISVLIIDRDNAPQRALMKSLGVSNLRLMGASILQYTILCIMVAAVAVPFGMGLSYLLIHLVNVQAFFWSYPLVVAPYEIIKIVLLSLAVLLAVVIFPAVRSLSRPPIEDLRCLQS